MAFMQNFIILNFKISNISYFFCSIKYACTYNLVGDNMDRLDGVGVTSLESSVTLNDRKNIVVTGVKKIESFNDKEFLMDTTLGPISIKGNDLEIIKLDTYQGNVSIKGYVNSFTYKEDGKKQKEESMLSKLFR